MSVQLKKLEAASDDQPLRLKAQPQKPLQSHTHSSEGFAVDWSPHTELLLATGDCRGRIHVWEPRPGGGWAVGKALRVPDPPIIPTARVFRLHACVPFRSGLRYVDGCAWKRLISDLSLIGNFANCSWKLNENKNALGLRIGAGGRREKAASVNLCGACVGYSCW